MKRFTALLASLACLGVGFAFAIPPTPVRNTHDPTLSNVATAPPHMSVGACAKFSKQVAVLTSTCERLQTLTAVIVAETETFSVIKDPGGTVNSDNSVVYAIAENHKGTRTLVGANTTAPPLNSGTLLRLTANVCAASAHGGGRNAEIV